MTQFNELVEQYKRVETAWDNAVGCYYRHTTTPTLLNLAMTDFEKDLRTFNGMYAGFVNGCPADNFEDPFPPPPNGAA